MIEKLGITVEKYGEIFYEMVELLIIRTYQMEMTSIGWWSGDKAKKWRKDINENIHVIEKATGYTWEEIKKILS